MMKKIVTWIVLADGARCRILTRETAVSDYREVFGVDYFAPHQASRKLASDRPGRVHDRFGTGRHAMSPPSDPHREEKRHFAIRLAELLESEREKKSFERLIVIAPPKTLGDLRQNFSPLLKNMIVEEIAKDVTMLKLHELQQRLPDMIEHVH
jgi:protein required for attachment to host cells